MENRAVAFVVDDEDIIASTLELILIAQGFDARSFVDPVDALLASESVTPSLLLTDVLMPGMTGIELAIRVTQRYRDCKVLLFSGQAGTTEMCAIAQLKGHNFPMLTKPVHPHALIDKIKGLFETVTR